MLYQRYENRIKKIAKIRVAIYKYRVPILIGISVILILIGWLLIKKGTIEEDLSLSSPTVTYGEDYSASAKTFMTEPEYQFKAADGEWTDGLPELVGDYKIRLKSRRTFGFYSYGEEQDFCINKKKFSVNYGNNIYYGEDPVKGFNVISGDEVKSYALTKNILYVGTTSVGLENYSVQIVNAENVDVTFCYEIDYGYRYDVTVIKKPVTIKTASASKIYDGTPLEKHELTNSDNICCYSDVLSLNYDNSITTVGSGKNTITGVKFTDGSGVDRTGNYSVSVISGTLTVNRRPITVKPEYTEKIYDKKPLSATDYEIVDGSFVEGESPEFTYWGSQTDAGESETRINSCIIKDGNGNPTHQNYNITYQLGSVIVKPRPIKVKDEGTKDYDDKVFEKTGENFEGEYGLCDGHTLTLRTNSVDAKVYRGDDITYTINDSDYLTKNYTVDVSECRLEITKLYLKIETLSEERYYNAEPLTKHEYEITAGYKLLTHIIIVNYKGTITDVGTADNEATVDIVRNGTSVKGNYDIKVEFGKLTVNKCPVTFTLSGTKVYDGTNAVDLNSLTRTILRISDNGNKLFKNHTPNYSVNALSGSDVGNYDLNGQLFSIMDGETDVTGNYEPEWKVGSFTITPRPLTIQTGTISRPYNREWLYYYEEFKGFSIINGTVADGQKIVVVSYTKIKEVGSADNVLEFIITANNGTGDYTANYNIDIPYGKLTVEKIKITIKLHQSTVTYNGNEQTFNDKYFKQGTVLEGDDISLKEITDTYKLVGTYNFTGDNSACNISYRDSYTGYYEITVQGELIIKKAIVEIKSKTAEKPNDGNPLTANDYEIITSTIEGGRWAAGDTVNVTCSGERIGQGSSPNTISAITINGVDYPVISDGQIIETDNYKITVKFGTLSLT